MTNTQPNENCKGIHRSNHETEERTEPNDERSRTEQEKEG